MAGQGRSLLVGHLLALSVCACSDPGRPPPDRTLPAVPLSGVWHRVQQGETLSDLARRYGVPRVDIEEINGLDRHKPLPVGRQLFIPGARKAAGAEPPPKTPPATVAAAKGRFIWPLSGGQVTSRFGGRGKSTHEGIDIAAPEGTGVLAAADGTVAYSGAGVRGYGNLILLRHADGYVTVYAHNRRNLVAEGNKVTQGQVIAEVGHTGRASGDHLHFEIRRGETPVDPLLLVKPGGTAPE
jgi:murein DD-endopeptidase MepM/ murein hydrolase activator NlpD